MYLVATATSAGTIVGSEHDFRNSGWNDTGEICVVCHAPHNNQNAEGELLWNHDESIVDPYIVYDSPTFDQTAANPPSGASKLCLSCHDGTVALDSFGGATGTNFISGSSLVGTDLSNDHPISFPYVVGAAEELNPVSAPVAYSDGTSGIISDLLFGTEVECSSCHDVHNTKIGPAGEKLVLVDNIGSALCLTCHAK